MLAPQQLRALQEAQIGERAFHAGEHRDVGATRELQDVERREREPGEEPDAKCGDAREPSLQTPHGRRVHQRPGSIL